MGGRGEVTLNIGPPNVTLALAAPISDLRRRFGWKSLSVRVSLVDVDTGITVPIGIAKVVKDGVRSYSFPTLAFRSTFGSGRTARLVLECDRTWTPPQFDASSDHLPRSVQLFAAGIDGDDPR
jgi:hypothetical protein